MKVRVFFATVAAAGGIVCGTASAAETFYAAPHGNGPFPCKTADPCSLPDAVNSAGNGDQVIALPGVHDLGSSTLNVYQSVNLHGVPGGRTRIESTADAAIWTHSGGRLADLRIDDPAGQALLTGFGNPTIERVRALGSSSQAACTAPIEGVLRDSTCVNIGTGPAVGGSGYAGAPLTWNFLLVNVTAYAAGSGPGIKFEGSGMLTISAKVTNTIAHGGGSTADVAAANSGSGTVTIELDHVNYHSGASTAASTITEVAGNQAVLPRFVDPTALNLHERQSSPTVDAGTAAVPSLGKLDFERQPRVQGGAPDIGADEFDHRLKLIAQARQHQTASKLKVSVSCPKEECTVLAAGRAKASGRSFTLESTGKRFLHAGQHRRLTLKPEHLHRLQELLRSSHGEARITIKGTDAGGVKKKKREKVELVG
jgi:hypothetical protein